jgi:ubiquinone biosynthesis protein
MKGIARAARIGRVLLRYRLDDLLDDTAAELLLALDTTLQF